MYLHKRLLVVVFSKTRASKNKKFCNVQSTISLNKFLYLYSHFEIHSFSSFTKW